MTINLINYALAKKDWEKAYEDLRILENGGRNLLRNSHFNGLNYWAGNGTATIAIENGYLKVIFGQSPSTPGLRYGPQITLEKGFYTASAKVNVENLSKPLAFYVLPNYRGTDVLQGGETGWRIITWTFEVTADQDTGRFYLLSIGTSSTDYMLVEWIKLEKGNKATDWTPAPEDINAHPFVAELAETVYRSKQNEERIRNLENALTALGGGS